MLKTQYAKNDIRNYVIKVIQDKITKLDSFIEFTIEASQDIKKTPKYDSIREEAQEEIYQLQKQMAGLRTLQEKMRRVTNVDSARAQVGSVVITNKARFYLSVSLGEFFYEGDRFYAISEESPMAQKIIGLQVGDEFSLNNIHQKLLDVI